MRGLVFSNDLCRDVHNASHVNRRNTASSKARAAPLESTAKASTNCWLHPKRDQRQRNPPARFACKCGRFQIDPRLACHPRMGKPQSRCAHRVARPGSFVSRLGSLDGLRMVYANADACNKACMDRNGFNSNGCFMGGAWTSQTGAPNTCSCTGKDSSKTQVCSVGGEELADRKA